MKALEIASAFIVNNRSDAGLTNLKLNKLLYFAQVESLRRRGVVLFEDAIEAWQYGPVVPAVYRAFKLFGSSTITSAPMVPQLTMDELGIVDYVAGTYGKMTAFDLVSLSHRPDGAWSRVYDQNNDREITVQDIVSSADYQGIDGVRGTLSEGIAGVMSAVPNALKMLENS